MTESSEERLLSLAENYYLDLRGSFDESIDKVCSPSQPGGNLSPPPAPAPDSDILTPPGSGSGSQAMSPPDPGPDTGAAVNTSLSSSVAGSERTVINVQERQETSGAGCWTNTLDSNMTDTSVDEPKYAKVQHKKRNSKIGSGNSTPKFKRKETIDSGSSRENLSKYEGSNLLASVACPGPVTPLPPAAPQPVSLHQAMDTITTEDHEEMEVNTTMTDKGVDVQSSRTKSRDSCQDALTLVYGHVLVVAGVVLPLLSFFSEVEKSSSEMFYIYLLLASILYLCFVQIDLMYLKTRLAVINHRRKKSLLTVKESLGDSGRSSKSSNSMVPGAARRQKKESVRRLLPGPAPATPSDLQEGSSLLGLAPAVTGDQYGSFYLRLGTVLFGIGSIIYVGIEMGGLFTLGLHSNKLVTCGDVFNILRPSLQIIFIFMQMHFIFLNHKMNVFRRQLVSRLGLMHLLVTNLCVWVRALIIETVDEVMIGDLERQTRESDNQTDTGLGLGSLPPAEGYNVSLASEGGGQGEAVMCDGAMMFSLSRVTSPYLYPCLVQYSLLAAAVLLTMWTRAAREHEVVREVREAGARLGTPGTLTSACSARVPDCNGSHGGLFCGVLVVVFTIVSLILTFVLVTTDPGEHPDLSPYTHSLPLADLVKFLSCLVIYLVASVAVLLGMCQMRSLVYEQSVPNFLNKILLFSSQTGILLYSVGSALHCDVKKMETLFELGSNLMIILQTLLQTLFLSDATHRFVFTSGQLRRKPGRQVVSFLLVVNITLWIVNIIHTSQTDLDVTEGVWFWSTVIKLSLPLCILYRFQSAVVLYEVWSKSFQFRPATVEYI